MMSWRRLLDRQENTRGTCKSSLIPARLRAFSEAIRLPAVLFGHKLFLLFVATVSHRRGAARSYKYDTVSLELGSGFSGGGTNTHVLTGNKQPCQQHASFSSLPEASTGCSTESDRFNAQGKDTIGEPHSGCRWPGSSAQGRKPWMMAGRESHDGQSETEGEKTVGS